MKKIAAARTRLSEVGFTECLYTLIGKISSVGSGWIMGSWLG